MKMFWQFHCSTHLEESMTFTTDTEASKKVIDADLKEVLSFLPAFNGLKILELGCGTGRFTGYLASQAKHVLAVDFIQLCIDQNKETNGKKYNNIEFMCEDVNKLKLNDNSFNFIFVNWLMMYLSDNETIKLASNLVSCLTIDGYIVFRESCEDRGWTNYEIQETDEDFGENPTFYRPHLFYTKIFNEMKNLELLRVSRVECYQEKKK